MKKKAGHIRLRHIVKVTITVLATIMICGGNEHTNAKHMAEKVVK